MKVTPSCPILCNPMDLYNPWNSPGQNTGVGSHSVLQGILPTQGSNTALLHCRPILYQLSHQGNPRILECVAYPFSSGSSPPRKLLMNNLNLKWETAEKQNIKHYIHKGHWDLHYLKISKAEQIFQMKTDKRQLKIKCNAWF